MAANASVAPLPPSDSDHRSQLLFAHRQNEVAMLFAPTSFLNASAHGNAHLWKPAVRFGSSQPVSEDEGSDVDDTPAISVEDATAELKSHSLPMIRDACLDDGLRLCYDASVLHQDEPVSLKAVADVDSIDFVSRVGGGTAFAHSAVTIVLEFEGGHVGGHIRASPRNSLEALPKATSNADARYGCYFRGSDVEGASKPLHIGIGTVYSVALGRILPLNYILPTGPRDLLDSEGMAPLREMFSRLVMGEAADDSTVSIPRSRRASTASMVTYLWTDLLLLLAGMVTTVGTHCNVHPRIPMFSQPNKVNGAEKKGALMRLAKGEWSITLCYMARFFAALEEESDLPGEERLFGGPEDDHLFQLPPDLLKQATDTAHNKAALNCLKRPVSDVAYHVSHFRDTIWGVDAPRWAAGHHAIDYRSRSVSSIGPGLPPNELLRTGPHAMPSPASAAASAQNRFVLQDLLVLRPVVYRFTAHGLKVAMPGPDNVLEMRDGLEQEFNTRKAWDAIIDIGVNFSAPSADSKVVLLFDAAQDASLFLPPQAQRSTTQKGVTTYGGPYWPLCATMGTRKTLVGSRGDANSFTAPRHPCSLRRIKIYDVDIHLAKYAGSTQYDRTNAVMQALLSRSLPNNIGRWKALKGSGDPSARGGKSVDKDFDRALEFLQVDIDRRACASSSLSDQVRCLRHEGTYGVGATGFGGSIAFRHAYRIARLNHDVQNGAEWTRANNNLPWWANISSATSKLVAVVNKRHFSQFTLALEASLLRHVRDAVAVARHTARHRYKPLPASIKDSFLQWIVESSLPSAAVVEICLFLAQGFYQQARQQVETRGYKRKGEDAVPLLGAETNRPTWFVRLSGLEATASLYGLPFACLDVLAVAFPILAKAHPRLRGKQLFRNQQETWAPVLSELGFEIRAESARSTDHRRFRFHAAISDPDPLIFIDREAVDWGVQPGSPQRWDAAVLEENAKRLWIQSNRWLQPHVYKLMRALMRNQSRPTLERALRHILHHILVLSVRILVGDTFHALKFTRGGFLEDDDDNDGDGFGERWYDEATTGVMESQVLDLAKLDEGTAWGSSHSFMKVTPSDSSAAALDNARHAFYCEFVNSSYNVEHTSAADLANILMTHVHACASGYDEIRMLAACNDRGEPCAVPWPSIRILSNMIGATAHEVEAAQEYAEHGAEAFENVLSQAEEMLATILLAAGFQNGCPMFVPAPSQVDSFLTDGQIDPPPMLHADISKVMFLTDIVHQTDLPPVPLLGTTSWWQKPRPDKKRTRVQAFPSEVAPDPASLQQVHSAFKTEVQKLHAEYERPSPRQGHLEDIRTRLRQLHSEGAETWWKALVQILLEKVLNWGARNGSEAKSKAGRAIDLLVVLFTIRSKCGGDEGIALHTANGENVATLALQPLESLQSVRLWNDKPLARRKLILEQAGGLEGLLEKGLGRSFKLSRPTSHRKGGIKAATDMLCEAGVCYKVYDDFSHSDVMNDDDVLRFMTWCPDEVYHNFPRKTAVPHTRVRCQVRLSPTVELLRIAGNNP